MFSDLNQCSDEKLVELITMGNNDAFAALLTKHLSGAYQTAFKFLRSKEDAEDVTQDCFLKLWKSPQKFNPQLSIKFTTWFSHVIRNRSLDVLKKQREEILNSDFDLEDDSKNQLHIIEENLEKLRVEEAMEKLSEDQRKAINLFFFEYRKHKESAHMMGLSLKAFQSLLMRSKKSLKLILNNNAHE